MKLFDQMKDCKGRVEYLLERNPTAQDNDNVLVAAFWMLELGKPKAELMTGLDFLRYFSEGKLTAPESIMRVRRKLQEQNPALRGVKYSQRQNDSQEMRKDINGL